MVDIPLNISSQSQGLVTSEPDLKDALNMHTKGLLLDLNCHHVGTIQEFDAIRQVAQITINYKKTFLLPDDGGKYVPKLKGYPMIIDAPVIFLGGGLNSLTFPVKKGDECLVLFNDRDIDNWWATSATSASNSTSRLHSYTDALVLVGVRSLPKVIPNLSTDSADLRNYLGTSKVTVSEDGSRVAFELGSNKFELTSTAITGELTGGVKLEIDATGKLTIQNITADFVTSLVQLFNDIQTGTVATLLGPQPLVMPTFAADLTLLQSFQP